MSEHDDYRERMHSAAQHLENAVAVQVYIAGLESELDHHRSILRIIVARRGPIVVAPSELRRVAELPPLLVAADGHGFVTITASP